VLRAATALHIGWRVYGSVWHALGLAYQHGVCTRVAAAAIVRLNRIALGPNWQWTESSLIQGRIMNHGRNTAGAHGIQ
jgi:hypothetical protein